MATFDKIEIGLNLASIKSDALPLADGVGSAGTSETLSRSDHIHPEGAVVVKSYPTRPTDPVLHEIFWNESLGQLEICTSLV